MRFILFILAMVLAVPLTSAQAEEKKTMNAYDFSFASIDGQGKKISLSDFKGKVVLVVNTASMCGFTKQYDGLQKLYEKYQDKGLVVLGVPSNDFGGQEPEKEGKIKEFCSMRFGITFPMTAKEPVKGKDAHPFYVWAGKQAGLFGRPKWNFHKYLIGKNGEFIDWFSSATEPTDAKIETAVEKALR